MKLEPGMFVRHIRIPDWGVGKVLALVPPDKVLIRFAAAGEKLLQVATAPLEAAQASPSDERFLERRSSRPRGSGVPLKAHDLLLSEFQRLFPGGFSSPDYLARERNYKWAAHEMAAAELGESRVRQAVEECRFNEVVTSALRVMNATNLVFPNEKMALKAGLASLASQQIFGRRLVELLYGAGPFQARFEAFADVLLEMGAAKWTIATYFPFILNPQEHMFLKPEVTQKAADAYGFWLAYDPRLNWQTYDRLLAFAKMLRERLEPLEPRDMLDVQSFLWVVGTDDSAT